MKDKNTNQNEVATRRFKNRKGIIAVLLALALAISGMAVGVFAQVNTVPGVHQSDSSANAYPGNQPNTNMLGKYDFLAPASNATIDIDLDMLADRDMMMSNAMKPVFLGRAQEYGFKAMKSDDYDVVGDNQPYWYAVYDATSAGGTTYRTTLNNDKHVEFPGELFYFTYKNAATLPDGSKANVRLTYSDAQLVKSMGSTLVNGYLPLASGTRLLANNVQGSGYDNARIGWKIKIKVQILDESGDPITTVKIDGKEVPATFYFPMVDLDIGRVGSGFDKRNDATRGLYDDNPSINRSYSEQIRIEEFESSVVKDANGNYVYIPGPGNTTLGLTDECYRLTIENDNSTDNHGLRFYNEGNGSQNNDFDPGTYRTGFVSMIDNTKGVTVTWWGSGTKTTRLQTFVCANGNQYSPKYHPARTVWHKITSESGLGGTIQTTAYGNKDGRLDEGTYGAVLRPGTYLVPEKRDHTVYTMTPNQGFEVASIEIKDVNVNGREGSESGNNNKTIISGDALETLKINGSLSVALGATLPKETRRTTHNTDPGFSYEYDSDTIHGELKYHPGTGVVTFDFPSNSEHHYIGVKWRQIPETVTATKIWDDFKNDYDTRQDVVFHIDVKSEVKVGGMTLTRTMKDVLPPQRINLGDTGDDLVKKWGLVEPYDTADGSTIEKVEELPKNDELGNPLLWQSRYTDNGLRYIATSTYTHVPVYIRNGNDGYSPKINTYLPRTNGPDDAQGDLIVYKKDGNTFTAYLSAEDAASGTNSQFSYTYVPNGWYQHTNGTFWEESDLPSKTEMSPSGVQDDLENRGTASERVYTTVQEHVVNVLPRFDEDGGRIEYIIRETLPDGTDVAANDPTKGLEGYITEVTEEASTHTEITTDDYEAVKPASGDDPSAKGWYEYDTTNSKYVASSDSAADPDKKYYVKSTVKQNPETQNYNVDNVLEKITEEASTELRVKKKWIDGGKKHELKEIANSFHLYQNGTDITDKVWDFANEKSRLYKEDSVLTNNDNEIVYVKTHVYERLTDNTDTILSSPGPLTERLPSFCNYDASVFYYRDGSGGYVDENGTSVSLPEDAVRVSFTESTEGDHKIYSFRREWDEATYTKVEQSDPEYATTTDPSVKGWYVKSGNDYDLTQDTSIQPGTDYYRQTITPKSAIIKFKEYKDGWKNVDESSSDFGKLLKDKPDGYNKGMKFVTITDLGDGVWEYEVVELPAYINYGGTVAPAVYYIAEDNDFAKETEAETEGQPNVPSKYLEPSSSELNKAFDKGRVTNTERIVIKANKKWEDNDNALDTRQDIALHLDATFKAKAGSSTVTGEVHDILPPYLIKKEDSGDNLTAVWGDVSDYGKNGSKRALPDDVVMYSLNGSVADDLPKDENNHVITYAPEFGDDGLRYIGYVTYTKATAFYEADSNFDPVTPSKIVGTLPEKYKKDTYETDITYTISDDDVTGTYTDENNDPQTVYYVKKEAFKHPTGEYSDKLPTKTKADSKNNNEEYKIKGSYAADGITWTGTVVDEKLLIDTPHQFIVNKLPRFDAEGNEISYSIRETLADGSDVAANDPKSGLKDYTTEIDSWKDFRTVQDAEPLTKEGDVTNTLYRVGLVGLTVDKTIKGRQYQNTDDFVFVLTGKNNTPMPVDTPIELDDSTTSETAKSEVVKHLSVAAQNMTADTVRGTVDFGVIAYTLADLDKKEVAYEVATNAEKKAVRYWTLTKQVQRKNENDEPLYDDGQGNETTDADDGEGNDYTPIMDTVTTVYDMKRAADKTAFENLSDADKKKAKGNIYSKEFKYQITENPQDSAAGDSEKIKNDSDVEEIKVFVLFDAVNNKMLASSKDFKATGEQDPKFETGVDITVEDYDPEEDVNDRIKPKMYLEKVYFENVYDGKTKWTPEATKILKNRPLERDQFRFILKGDKTLDESGNAETGIAIPMPENADQGKANSISQDVVKAETGATNKGTNDLVGPVKFGDIEYTNDDLKAEVKYGDVKNKAIAKKVSVWETSDYRYGPIPDGAKNSKAIVIDGVTFAANSLTYAEATDAQRKAAMGTTENSLWKYENKTCIDYVSTDPAVTTPTVTIPDEAKGTYYMAKRTFVYKMWEDTSYKYDGDKTNYGVKDFDAHKDEASAYEIKVLVKRNPDGTITATPGVQKVDENGNPLYIDGSGDETTAADDGDGNNYEPALETEAIFENEYKAEGDVQITLTKQMDGRDEFGRETLPEGSKAKFKIEKVTSDAPLPSDGTGRTATDNEVEVTFTGSKTSHTLTSDEAFKDIKFTHEHFMNSGKTEYTATRNKDGLYERTFVYKITETSTTNMTDSTDPNDSKDKRNSLLVSVTVQEDAYGNIKVVRVNNADATELNADEYKDRFITLKEDKAGNYLANPSVIGHYTVGAGSIYNTYNAAGSVAITAEKKMTGRTTAPEENQFYFRILELKTDGTETGRVIDAKPNAADGKVTFDSILYDLAQVRKDTEGAGATATGPDTEDETSDKEWTYKYKVKEIVPSKKGRNEAITYDETEYIVTVKVTDKEDKTLETAITKVEKKEKGADSYTEVADKKIIFTNEDNSVDIKAEKIWNDSALMDGTYPLTGYDRPKSVSVKLTATPDGGTEKEVDRVALDTDNSWKHTWEKMPQYDDDGNLITYKVSEVVVPDGYTVEYSMDNATWTTATPDVSWNSTDDISQSKTVYIQNTPEVEEIKDADLTLLKKDAVTGKAMESVEFALSKLNTETDEYDSLGSASTDANGKAYFKFSEEGTYKLVETVPTGYNNDKTEYILNVTKDAVTSNVKVELEGTSRNIFQKFFDLLFGAESDVDYDASTKTLTVENTPKVGDAYITKKFLDEDGNIIPDDAIPAGFKIDASYQVIEEDQTTGEKSLKTETKELTKANKTSYDSSTGIYTWKLENVVYDTKVTAEESGYEYGSEEKGYTYDSTETTITGKAGSRISHSAASPTYGETVVPAAAATRSANSGDSGTTDDNTATINFVNKYKRDKGVLDPIKVWDDGSDKDGMRPDSITFTVNAKEGSTPVDVFDDGQGGKTSTVDVTLTKADNTGLDEWKYSNSLDLDLYGLPTHTADGKWITYEVVESMVPDYYTCTETTETTTLAKNATTNTTITNKHKSVAKNIDVTKEWDDDSNSAGRRQPTTVYLYKQVGERNVDAQTGEVSYSYSGDPTLVGKIKEGKISIDDSNNVTVDWSSLPAFENGAPIRYTVKENAVKGYTTEIKYAGGSTDAEYGTKEDEYLVLGKVTSGTTSAENGTAEITNTYEPGVRDLEITKVWDDEDNIYARPQSITATITAEFADGSPANVFGESGSKTNTKDVLVKPGETGVEEVDADTWKWTYDGREEIEDPQDSSQTILNPDYSGFKLPEYVDDAGKATQADPAGTNGREVVYFVTEKTTPNDYSSVVERTPSGKYTITNSYTPETIEVTITKIWNDHDNDFGTRPDTLAVKLYDATKASPIQIAKDAYGAAIPATMSAANADQTDPNKWTMTVTVPKYDQQEETDNPAPKAVKYGWTEDIPEGYWASYEADGSQEQPGPGTTEISEDGEFRNEAWMGELTVEKTWDDQDDVDEIRPDIDAFADSLTVAENDTGKPAGSVKQKSASGNKYTVVYEGLPIYDKNGQKLEYKVEEADIDGYTLTGNTSPKDFTTETDQEGFVSGTAKIELTNEHTPATTDIEITKNWYNQTGFEHMTAAEYADELHIFADNTEKSYDQADESTAIYKPTVTGSGDKYTVKWTGLPKYVKDGADSREIVYKVTEDQITGYGEPVYDNKGAADKSKKGETTAVYDGGEINNIQLIKVDVEKEWQDNDDHDGKRGDIKVTLYRNGVEVGSANDKETKPTGVVAEKTLTETDAAKDGNKWTWTSVWTDLPYADKNGVPYNYTATETAKPADYAAADMKDIRQIFLSVWNDDKDTLTFQVRNTNEDDTIDFTVDKIWDDENDIDGLRPNEITYELYQEPAVGTRTKVTTLPNGATVEGGTFAEGVIKVTYSEKDKTNGTQKRVTLKNFPKYDVVGTEKGKLITYTIEEKDIAGYTKSVTGDQTAGFTARNTHSKVGANVADAKFNKVISGREFESGDKFKFLIEPQNNSPRPARDYLTMVPTVGQTTEEGTVPAINITGKDINEGGTAVTLADLIANPVGSVEEKSEVFTYKVREVNGGETMYDLVYDDSVLTLKITVSWDAAQEELVAVSSWEDSEGTTITGNNVKFTNIYGKTGMLTLRKAWIDTDPDGTAIVKRPKSVVLRVTADKKPADTGWTEDTSGQDTTYYKDYTLRTSDLEANSDNVWKINTEVLPRTDEHGDTITYTVSEPNVPKNYADNSSYPAQIKVGDIYTVINSYETVELAGTKVWTDGGKTHNNATEVKLTVHWITNEGTDEVDGTLANAHIDWDKTNKDSFKVIGLPKYDDEGNEYTYWITETAVDGYDAPVYDNSESTDTSLTSEQKAATDKLYNGGKVENKIKQDAVTIDGDKKWVGGEDSEHDNTALNVTLYRQSSKTGAAVESGTDIKKVEKDADDNWVVSQDAAAVTWTSDTGNSKYTFSDLPKYDAEGYEYTYWVVEGQVPAGYAVTYKNDADHLNAADKVYDNGTITNTSTKKDSIKVSKTWADNKDAEGLRPEKITVHLYKKVTEGQTDKTVQVEVDKKEITGTAWNDVTWTDLPVYDADGAKIEYQVVEESEYGYTTTYTTKADPADADYTADDNKVKLDGTDGAQEVKVKNALVPKTSEVKVEKKWNDGDNVDGIRRPDNVTVELWAREWNKTQNKYGDAAKVTTRPAVQADVDAADPAESVELGDPVAVENLTLRRTDGWKGSWENLPLTKNGKTVLYSVKEVTTDSSVFGEGKYDTNYVVSGDQVDGFEITNTHKQLTTSASIEKGWSDQSNALQTRPKKLTMQLMRKYEGADGQTKTEAVITDINGDSVKSEMSADDEDPDADTWKRTVKNLPRYINVNTGTQEEPVWTSKEITYFWKETVPNGYSAAGKLDDADVTDANGSISVDNGSKVTNSMRTGKIVLTKTWNDKNDHDNRRPSNSAFVGALTLYEGKLKAVEGNDAGSTGISVVPTQVSTTNETVVTYENLPIYDAAGNKITYKVEEGVIEGYTLETGAVLSGTLEETGTGSGVFQKNMTATNKHEVGSTTFTITKEWDDEDNKYGQRPTMDELKEQIKLYRQIEGGSPAEVGGVTPAVTDEGNGRYTLTWSNLDRIDDNENDYTYTATETVPTSGDLSYYKASVTAADSADGQASTADAGETTAAIKNGGTVTNKQMYRDVEVRNTWIDTVKDTSGTDVSGHTGYRPDNITVKLTDAGGTVLKDASGNDLTQEVSSADTTKKITFAKVPIYKADGTTKETVKLAVNTDNKVPNYKTEIDQDKMEIVNTYQIDRISGTKKWVDGGIKHDNTTEVVLTLERTTETDPANFDTATWTDVTDESFVHLDWKGNTWTFANLPEKDKNGNAFTYRVKEKIADVRSNTGNPDYQLSYSNIGAFEQLTDAAYKGGEIENKLSAKKGLTGTKTWVNGAAADHVNTGLSLKLYRESRSNGGSVGETEVTGVTLGDWTSATGNATYTFGSEESGSFVPGEYDKYDANGYEYVYYVKDESGQGENYEPSYDGLNTTNTRKPTTAKIKPEFIKKAADMPQELIDAGGKEFTFLLAPQTNTVAIATDDLDKEKTVKVTGNGDGNQVTFDFDEMTFTKAGTYTYKLVEKAEDGWTCSAAVTSFTIKVTDTNGVLSAAIEWPQGADVVTDTADDSIKRLRVTNTYDPKAVASSVTDGIGLTKALNKPAGVKRTLKAEEFSFTMKGLTTAQAGTGYKDASNISDATGTNKRDGTVEMSAVTFTEAGKYAFEITEDVPTNKEPGMTYATTKYKVEAEVKGAADGKLTVTWKILKKDGTASSDTAMSFENSYDNLKVEEEIFLKKILEGRKLKANEFEFILSGDDTASQDNQAQQTVKNTAGGALDTNKKSASEAFKFANKIPFTLEDICDHDGSYFDHDNDGAYSREFVYKLFEKPGNINGVTYDGTVHELKATLKYVAAKEASGSDPAVDEHLEVAWTLDGTAIDFRKATPDTVDFNNKYDPDAITSSVTDGGGATVAGGTVDVTKRLEVPAGQERSMTKDEFVFELLDKDDNRVAIGTNKTAGQSVTGDINDSQSAVSMAPITFTKAMVEDAEWKDDTDGSVTGIEGASYAELTYTIKEIEGNNKDDLIYDTHTATVKAILIENDGTLQVKWVLADGQNAVFTNKVPAETVNKPVRVTWVNDTEIDRTVGKDGVSKERPESVTVTLQMRTHTYTYGGKEYPTREAALKAAEDAGDDNPTITASSEPKLVDVPDPSDPTKSWSITLDKNDAKDGDPDNWFSDVFKDLPKYDPEGTEIVYSFAQTGYKPADGTEKTGTKTGLTTEAITIPGYSSTPISIPVNGMLTTLLNAYEVTIITGTKTWIDPNPAAHNNSSEIEFTVVRKNPNDTDNDTDDVKTLTPDEDYHVDWSDAASGADKKDKKFTIRGLTKYVDANATTKVEYQYEVTETAVPGYTTTYKKDGASTAGTDPLDATGGEIINVIDQDTVSIKVTKKWVGEATDDVTFKLNSNAGGTVDTVNEHEFKTTEFGATGGSVDYTFTKDSNNNDLPKYDLDPNSANYGKEIQYTVAEVPDGNDKFDTTPAEGNMADGFTITNVNKETTTVYAQKQWSGDAQAKDNRKNVQFRLIQTIDGASKPVADYDTTVDGATKTITGTQTIEADMDADVNTNAGTVNWPNLPKFDKNGDKITYTVEEITDLAEYTAAGPTGEGTANAPFIITNSLDGAKVSIPVMKKWDDGKDRDGLRPESVTVRLMNGDDRARDKDNKEVEDITLKPSNNWKLSFDNLPKIDAAGGEIAYTVVEMDGGTAKKSGDKIFGDEYTVDISRVSDKLSDGFVVTNTHEPETRTIRAEKVWTGEDSLSDAQKKTLHKDVIVHLYGYKNEEVIYYAGSKKIKMGADGKPEGKAEWKNVPARYYNDSDLEWKVVEDSVFGYTSKVTGNAEEGFTVTNTYTVPKTAIKVTKDWQDDGYNGRPTKVTYVLKQKVMDGDTNPVTEYGRETVTVGNDGKAEFTWKNLPVVQKVDKGTEENTRVEYTDKEQQVTNSDGQLIYVNKNDDTDKKYIDPSDKTTFEQNYPDYEALMETVQVPKEITEDAPVVEDVPIMYSVEELYEDNSENGAYNLKNKGYEKPVVKAVAPGEFEVMNVRVPDVIDIKVKKVWVNDNDVKKDERPDSIGLTLKKGNEVVDTATLTPKDKNANTWEYTFKDMPADGNYAVEESKVKGYAATVTGNANNGFVVTNTYSKNTMKLTAVKQWAEDNDKKSKRSDVKLHLVRVVDGEWKVVAGQDKTIKANRTAAAGKDAGSVTWTGLPTRVGGKDVAYTVQEDAVSGYVSSVSDVKKKSGTNNEFTVTVTNTLAEKMTPVSPDKSGDVIFIDPKNPDGKMVLRSTKYGTYGQAEKAADALENKPADPSHDGVKFVGWDLNYDENGNYVLVAKYSDIPEKDKTVVSYIDGFSKNALLISRQTDDPSSVDKPEDPSHANLIFTGWKKVTDEAGNTVYVAQYKVDCGNQTPEDSEKEDSDKPEIEDPDKPDKDVEKDNRRGDPPGTTTRHTVLGIVNTSDANDILMWLILAMAATAGIMATYAIQWRREHAYARKH